MANHRPEITIVVPTYERPEYLQRALNSIQVQIEAPARVIVSDNGSSTDTREVVHAFAGRSACDVDYIRHEVNIGALANLQSAIAAADTDYVKILWDDDWLDPNCLSVILDTMESTGAEFVVTGAYGHVMGVDYLWYQQSSFVTSDFRDVLPGLAAGLYPVSPLAGLQRKEDLEWVLHADLYHPDALRPELFVGPDAAMTYGGLLRRRKMAFIPDPVVHMFSDGANMTGAFRDELQPYYVHTMRAMAREAGTRVDRRTARFLRDRIESRSTSLGSRMRRRWLSTRT